MSATQLATELYKSPPCDPVLARQDSRKVHLTVDGAAIEVAPGTTILEAARLHGIQIPVLCHQSNERPAGVCRVCSVDTGERTLTAACARAVEERMVVTTSSEKVRQARGILLELLLADHPSPCARQRKSGDCELEQLAISESVGTPRFSVHTGSHNLDYSSPIISVDRDACVLCDRCIRACNEVRHNNVLGRMGKGYSAQIAFDLNDLMGESSCVGCGECMLSCPTGALTNKIIAQTELPDGQPPDIQFLKQLPYFEELSGTFLELNKNAVVIRKIKSGDVICREGEYGSTAFVILEGEAEVFLEHRLPQAKQTPRQDTVFQKLKGLLAIAPAPSETWSRRFIPIDASVDLPMGTRTAQLGPGDLFGEMSCISHYPRSATVRATTDCTMLEVLRNVLDMMLQRNVGLRAVLDSNYRKRGLKQQLRNTPLLASVSDDFLERLAASAELLHGVKNQVICQEGTAADSLYLVRTGFVKVSEGRDAEELVLAYFGPGSSFGEASLFDGGFRTASVTALDTVDLVRIHRQDFEETVQSFPEDRPRLEKPPEEFRPKNRPLPSRPAASLQSFLKQGLMEANSLLILDLEKCTRCDNCVRACADAHEGVTRLIRDGERFDKYLVASSCRQCRDPLCMAGCPVGSIRRRNFLEIVIEDWCIGCGLCAENCPYGNIHMQPVELSEDESLTLNLRHPAIHQKATSCDLCSGLIEPSCVYACPHDAAHRVNAIDFFSHLSEPALRHTTVT